jgi:hypothetical protein
MPNDSPHAVQFKGLSESFWLNGWQQFSREDTKGFIGLSSLEIVAFHIRDMRAAPSAN